MQLPTGEAQALLGSWVSLGEPYLWPHPTRPCHPGQRTAEAQPLPCSASSEWASHCSAVFPGLAPHRQSRNQAGPCKKAVFGLILPTAQNEQPWEAVLFAEASQLCQMCQALPFPCRASLAKGLSVHTSVGLLGVLFYSGGGLDPRLDGCCPCPEGQSQGEVARKAVSQGLLCSCQ